MSLKGLLSTVLSPTQEENIGSNASHCLSLLVSSPSILTEADGPSLTKFKVRVSALIQSKKPIARWFGCYLCKISVESSCYLILKTHGGTWAGLLQHVLEVKEPVVTHQIAIQALSSLFSATYGKPTFTREITTPRLSEYLKQLFNLSSKEPQLLSAIVPALSRILSQQSTTFRPFAKKTHTLLTELLRTAIVDPHKVDGKLVEDSCEAMVLLHMSAAKGQEQDEWASAIKSTISEINYTVGQIAFEFVDEDNIPQQSTQKLDWLHDIADYGNTIKFTDKLEILLKLLKAFFVTPTKVQVKIPFGKIMSLADRLYTLPFSTEKAGVETDHRKLFYGLIDRVNFKLTETLITSISIIGHPIVKYMDSLLHHIITIIKYRPNLQLKLSLLRLTTQLLNKASLLPSSYTQDIGKLVKAALVLIETKQLHNPTIPDMISAPDAFVQTADERTSSIVNEFMVAVLEACPELPLYLRSQIDRHFIMNGHKYATISALYPGVSKYSIAPIAAKVDPESRIGSLMMHPRLPPLPQAGQEVLKQAKVVDDNLNNVYMGEMEEDENMAEEVAVPVTVETKNKLSQERKVEEPSISKPFVSKEPRPQESLKEEQREITYPSAPDSVPVRSPLQQQPERDLEPEPVASPVSAPQTAEIPVAPKPSLDEESDIEIPTLAVDSDSDDDL